MLMQASIAIKEPAIFIRVFERNFDPTRIENKSSTALPYFTSKTGSSLNQVFEEYARKWNTPLSKTKPIAFDKILQKNAFAFFDVRRTLYMSIHCYIHATLRSALPISSISKLGCKTLIMEISLSWIRGCLPFSN